ncbi:MAG: S8 family peptidase [Clostridia bacterium]|nr:S8 family peptidase [Clostridia bacterium]
MPIKPKDLDILSERLDIKFIFNNEIVFAEKFEKEFINITKLTNNLPQAKGQTICFIDTGIYPHFDFLFPKNRIIKFIDLINHKNQPYDDNGHGTFVAGVASSNGILDKTNTGFAVMSNIIMIKALSKDGSSSSNTILDAMQWIYENYKKYKINTVCMSFGADSLEVGDPLSKGAEILWKKGITVVAAGGNSGPDHNTIKSPGCNPRIITVGSFDKDSMQISNFSSRGPTLFGSKPDLIAPGVDVVSCSMTPPYYSTMSGTSVSTPIIAGICANLKGINPKITNEEIKSYLINHCHHITFDKNDEGAGYIKF